MLVNYTEGFRCVWMFPRNIRRIEPWKLSEILNVLMPLVADTQWSGNQDLQTQLCKALESINLKSEGFQRDPHSGGPRTYLSQLTTLGLVYKNGKKSFELTKAGEDIAEGNKPLEVLQTLLFNHQYPSSYSIGQNIKIHPEVKIKPFLFVLELINDPEIEYLTSKEFLIPVMYGHNSNCFRICKQKILQFRKTKDIKTVIDNHELDTYLPRSKNSSFDKRLANINDIGNTCKNYLQAACLLIIEKNGKTERYFFNDSFRDRYIVALSRRNKFIPNHEHHESFQRSYGSWNKSKDTSRNIKSKKLSKGENIITGQFMRYCGTAPTINDFSNFVNKINSDYGFDKKFINKIIEPYISKSLDIFEAYYLDLATGGQKTALEFEIATGKIFREKLGFFVEETGQKYRSKGVGGYSDLLLISEDKKTCAIVDTKASALYNLSSDDYHKMVNNYLKNFRELVSDKKCKLKFCTYVAGGFQGRIEPKLKQIKSEANIHASIITARRLLEIANTQESNNVYVGLLQKTHVLDEVS